MMALRVVLNSKPPASVLEPNSLSHEGSACIDPNDPVSTPNMIPPHEKKKEQYRRKGVMSFHLLFIVMVSRRLLSMREAVC